VTQVQHLKDGNDAGRFRKAQALTTRGKGGRMRRRKKVGG
jgi:hypothetical protein